MKRIGLIVALILIMIISSVNNFALAEEINPSSKLGEIDYATLVSDINTTNIYRHIEYFVKLGSRFTGYPGNEKAADYVHGMFLKYGLNVSRQRFEVVIPVGYGATVEAISEGQEYEVYPLWPNLVAPVTTDKPIIGRLLYVGTGSLREISEASADLGISINESILLMDFNSDMHWLEAAKLGAKAVIFLGNSIITTREAKRKFLDSVPLSFPRLYAPPKIVDDLMELANRGSIVKLTSKMIWERREASNIIGVLRGERWPDKYIMLTSYYDSFSYIPSVAPGAQEAVGISTLLELARFFSENPPGYTIIFVAFSGHNIGLVGSREFVQEYIFNRWEDFGSKIQVQLNLDLTTETDMPAPITSGTFYTPLRIIGGKFNDFWNFILHEIKPEIERQLGEKFEVPDHGTMAFGHMYLESAPFPYDNEPLTFANGPGLGFITAYSGRMMWGTPSDTLDRINIANLEKQLRFIFPVIYKVANTPNLTPNLLKESKDWKIEDAFWASLSGRIMQYNYSTGWYDPVPEALFLIRLIGGELGTTPYMVWAGIWSYSFSNEKGEVFVSGLSISPQIGPWAIQAYKVDPETGHVIYAPDMGQHQFSSPSVFIIKGGGEPPLSNHHDFGYFVLFKSGSLVIFDTFDPRFLNVATGTFILPLSFESHSSLESRGVAAAYWAGTALSVTMIFIPPSEPAEIIIRAPYAIDVPLALLINASEENQGGVGYTVKAGQQIIVDNTPLRYAENYYWLSIHRERMGYIISREVEKDQNRLRVLIQDAYRDIKHKSYGNAYVKYTEAWALGREINLQIRTSLGDAVSTVPLFAFLLVLFAILAERLLFNLKGNFRVLAVGLLYIIPTAILWRFHIGFQASDLFTILLGCSGVILSIPPLMIIISAFTGFLQQLKRRILGEHFISISRTSALMSAFSVGIGNMRRRKMLTILSLTAIILITLSLVNFASMSALPLLRWSKMEVQPPYTGILVKSERSLFARGISLGEKVLENLYLKYAGLATIIPRAWSYPDPYLAKWTQVIIKYREKSALVSAFAGLTSEETYIADIEKALVKGRWFEERDIWVCIISKEMADNLGVTETPARLTIMGINFTLIGILDDIEFEKGIKDLTGENEMIPLDVSSPDLPRMPLWYIAEGIVLVPYETLPRIGSVRIANVAMFVEDEKIAESIGREIFRRYGMETYIGVGNKTYVYSVKTSYQIIGLQFQIVPFILVALILLDIGIGSVYERRREIEILNSVGLSPIQVSGIFLSEFIVKAIVGGVLGYLSALAAWKASTTLFQIDISLNFASSWTATAILLTMLVTLISAIYPIYKVSKLVTPSLERKWKIKSKPKGDEWLIDLPFTTESDGEARGILTYLHEFLDVHRGEVTTDFAVEDLHFRQYMEDEEEKELSILEMRAILPPREAGIRQRVKIIDVKNLRTGKHTFQIQLLRISGEIPRWQRANHDFIDSIRKQFLNWSFMKSDKRMKYLDKSEKK